MSQRFYYTTLKKIGSAGGTGGVTPIAASNADRFLIKYVWPGTLGGGDADTFTGIEPGTGTIYDGVKNATGQPTRYVGYNSGTGYVVSSTGTGGYNDGGTAIISSGDNTSTAGQECVLINPLVIKRENPGINIFNIGLYLNWFATVGTGCLDIFLYMYEGGTYSVNATTKDITNTGGTLLATYQFNANTDNSNNSSGSGFPSNGINGYGQIGIFTFTSDNSGGFSYNVEAVGNCGEYLLT